MSSKNKSYGKEQAEAFAENCRYLGLKLLAEEYQQMINRANESSLGYYDFINNIVQTEAAAKKQRRIETLIKNSRLPQPLKMLADFDFDFQPSLDRRLIMDLATLGFIERNESILFTSKANGVGKSHIARSLALLACQHDYKTYYTTCSDLINDLNAGVYEKTLAKRMRKYTSPDLLVIDEMGHDRLELQVVKEAHLLFKIIDQRYNDNKSLIFTTNVEEPDWAEFLGDPITTSAILDRIFHHSVIVRIDGPSYRMYQSEQLQKKYTSKKQEAK
ncbi:mobile element protein [Geofilum rubicundum JCM 15548]|uniref:Mobile element protein n=2 Tax=Geofilum TaxID=1236988 RepID=A0A0E9LQE3_9BACT|nr:mobile element protein [Geofilum rubicundum JCM 15548]